MFPLKADDGHRSHVVHMRMTVCKQSGASPGSLPPFPKEPAGCTIPTPPTALLRLGRGFHRLHHEHSYCVTYLHSPNPCRAAPFLHEPWRVRIPEVGAEEKEISLRSSKELPKGPPHDSLCIWILRKSTKVTTVHQRGNHNKQSRLSFQPVNPGESSLFLSTSSLHHQRIQCLQLR